MAHNRHIVHYIPPVKQFPELEREFIHPVCDDYFIHWLFRHRCMECGRPGQEINEIVPRSRSKKSVLDWKNRVLLCRNCHGVFHLNGVTMDKIRKMQERRHEFLISIDRRNYL